MNLVKLNVVVILIIDCLNNLNLGSNKYPYKGLKTKPKISEVMKFPDSIPIDYMHLVLLGMFKKLGELYLPVIKKSIINYNFF